MNDNLKRLLSELEPLGLGYEVLIVSDGNTDETVVEAERVGSPNVKVLAYDVNRGKGYAIGYGVRHSVGDLVTFIDPDGDLHPKEIPAFMNFINERRHDIVVASKRHPASKGHYPFFRRLHN